MSFRRYERNGAGKAKVRGRRPGAAARSSPRRNARRSSGSAGGATIGPVVGGPISGVSISANGQKYRLTDAAGRRYTWSRGQLEDTLFESSKWDSAAVRRKALGLKPGQSMKRGGETLEALGRNTNMAKKRRTQRNLSTSEAREKIRKLLALAKDRGDAPEGRLALGRARAIAKKYGLESALGSQSTALARPSPKKKRTKKARKATTESVRAKPAAKKKKRKKKKAAKKAAKKKTSSRKVAKRTSSAPARKAPRRAAKKAPRRRKSSRAGKARSPSVCVKPSQGVTASQADVIARAVEAALRVADRPPTPGRKRRKKGSSSGAVAKRTSSAPAKARKPAKKKARRKKPCSPDQATRAQVKRAACVAAKARWGKDGRACKPKGTRLPNAQGKRGLKPAAGKALAKARWDKVCRNFNNVRAELC